MKDIRKYFLKIGLPEGDLLGLPTSRKSFPDGAQFRIEVPTVNTIEAMIALLDRAKELRVTINRIDETYGIMRHTDEELEEMIKLAKQNGVELNLSHGPRAKYDTSATAKTPMGAYIAYRLRGTEQLIRAVEDIRRGIDLGCRGFLVYDEGLLWILGNLRKDGIIPSSIKFKCSAHCGHGNPSSAKLMESLGADSFNPCRDLELPMIAAIRQAITIPLDVHVDNPPASGGFIRTYEAPEFVRIGAPIHLKCGNSALSAHGVLAGEKE
ncbi:MAG: peptidase, partial [Candidatus Hodarchaeota archaeon]